MYKKLLFVLCVVAVGIVTYHMLRAPAASDFVYVKENASATMPADVSSTTAATEPVVSAHTLLAVSTHDSVSSCWVVVSGKVYDLTKWVSQHPGGPEKISRICGTDATSAFNTKHGEDTRPVNTLSTFLIGELAQP